MSIKALQDYTFTAKYANYNKEEQRRETWDESIDRVLNMHIKKYPQIEEDLKWAFEESRKKKKLTIYSGGGNLQSTVYRYDIQKDWKEVENGTYQYIPMPDSMCIGDSLSQIYQGSDGIGQTPAEHESDTSDLEVLDQGFHRNEGHPTHTNIQ